MEASQEPGQDPNVPQSDPNVPQSDPNVPQSDPQPQSDPNQADVNDGSQDQPVPAESPVGSAGPSGQAAEGTVAGSTFPSNEEQQAAYDQQQDELADAADEHRERTTHATEQAALDQQAEVAEREQQGQDQQQDEQA